MRRMRLRPIRSEMGPEMTAKRPTMREYAVTSVPRRVSAMSSCSPIWGRMGEMIMIWLLAENTSNQSEKTMRYGEVSRFFNSSILAS
jgi:hypothetical protein